MLLDTTVKKIIKVLGHDGSEILWPDCREPLQRRGFHIQEMIDYCYFEYGIKLTPFEPMPASCPVKYDSRNICPKMFLSSERRMEMALSKKGVILGETLRLNAHAVAWDGKEIYDPVGMKYPIDKFRMQTFWMI